MKYLIQTIVSIENNIILIKYLLSDIIFVTYYISDITETSILF